MKKIILFITTLALLTTACSPAGQQSATSITTTTQAETSGQQEDTDDSLQTVDDYLKPLTKEIVQKIEKRFRRSYLDFDDVQAAAPDHLKFKTIIEAIESMPVHQQYLTMYQAFAVFNDAHTNFIVRDLYYGFSPIIIERMSDGFYIINASANYRDMIGQKVLKIDDVDIETWLERATSISASDSDYGRDRDAIDALHGTIVYSLFENKLVNAHLFTTDNETREVKFMSYFDDDVFLKNDNNLLRLGSFALPMFIASDKDPYGYRIDETNKIVTIYFHTLSDLDTDELMSFGQEVRNFITDNEDYIVAFDFRTCLGGAIAALPTIFEVRFLKKINDRAYSLVARNSMSAGTTMPDTFRRLGDIPIIGEATPYSPYTSGVSSTADNYSVDDINIEVRMSFSNGDYQKRLDTPTLTVDYVVVPTYKDFTGQRDVWYDKLISLKEDQQ